jgi:hypothetical protein
MHVGVKFGVSLAMTALAATAFGVGAVAGAAQPPGPGQEEGHGPGAIVVRGTDAARAAHRINAYDLRARWCHGRVAVRTLNVRSGPGTGHTRVGAVHSGHHIYVNWDTLTRNNGYDWVRLSADPARWIADYKLGNGNGKWYVKYSDCS